MISLGATCTPAWQIRKFTGSEEILLPFDWLDTPFRSLISVLETDFEGIADGPCFQLLPDRTSVINSKVDILYQHDFGVGPDGLINRSWQTRLTSLPRKYKLIIERWRNTLDGSNSILFVRHEGHFDTRTLKRADLSMGEMEALCDLIERKYPRISFDVLFVSAGGGSEVPTHPRIKLATVGTGEKEWKDPKDLWKGNTRDWQEVLLKANRSRPTGPAASRSTDR